MACGVKRKMRKLSIWPVLLPLALNLSACVTLSPLEAAERVDVSGRIEKADGSPAENVGVTLDPSNTRSQTVYTGANGDYQFALTGAQTQSFGGSVAKLPVTVNLGEGQSLTQHFMARKTQIALPTMRAWDGLQYPDATAVLEGEKTVFRWQQPNRPPSSYVFWLYDADDLMVWSKTTDQLSVEVPLAVMEAGKSYRWQVKALFADYEAHSRKRAVAAEPLLKTAPVASVQVPGQAARAYPSFFDGDNDFDIANRIKTDPKSTGAIDLVVKLKQPAALEGLYWKGGYNAVDLEVRSTPAGSPLATQHVSGSALISWVPFTGDTLYLRAYTGETGFLDLAELRPLRR